MSVMRACTCITVSPGKVKGCINARSGRTWRLWKVKKDMV